MKKILLIVLSLFVFGLIGCTNTTSSTQSTTENDKTTTKEDVTTTKEDVTTTEGAKLDAPTGLSIEKGVVSFNEVEGADSYTLKIMQEGATVMNISVENGTNISGLLEDGDYEAQIYAKKGTSRSSLSEAVEFYIGVKQIDITTVNELSGEYLSSESYVNMSGRHYYNENDSRMYFYFTASGFKVSFTGTKLEAKLYATGYNKSNNEARIVVLVDGETYPEGGTTIVLNKAAEATYTLCSDLDNKKHTVEVLKRSEATDNTIAITSLTTDGNFETPEADKEKSILVLGASGSTGYGNLAKNTSVVKNTYNSDGLKAFAYLTARMYDTEIDEINASGWGTKWGWNSQSGLANIPAVLSKVGINSTSSIEKVGYEYTRDSYDLVIINLGMNDFNAYLKNLGDDAFATKLEEYKAATKAFYNVLLDAYDCPILILHTSNTNDKAEGKYNEQVAKEINDSLESPRIFSIIIPANGSGTNYGANSHANVQTHIWTADRIAEWIEANLGWTKVRANLTFTPSRDQVD